MSLRIQLLPLDEMAPDSVLEWELVNSAREVVKRGRSPLREMPKSEACDIVLAAPDVLLLELLLPNFGHAKLHLALPGLMEDTLLGDVENAFLVAGPRDSGGRGAVAAVDKGRLRHVLDMLKRAGMRVRSASAEPLAVALSSRCWRVRVRERYACVRTGPYSGFATSSSDHATPPAELLLALAQAKNHPPACIEVEGAIDEAAWQAAVAPVPLRAVTAKGLIEDTADLELLRYEFSPRMGDGKVWRPTVVAGGAFLLVALLGLNLHAWQLHQESARLRKEIEGIFKQSFPAVQSILDPVLQMRRAVDTLRGASGTAAHSDFIALATQAAALLKKPDVVQSMEYANGVLQMDISPAYEKDKAWQEQMVKAAVQVGFAANFSGARLTFKHGANK